MKTTEACRPLLNLLQDEILAGSSINIDENTLQVLSEPGRDPTSKSYMSVCKGDPEKQAKGYVQTDGYSGYTFLDHGEEVRHIGCWAHACRNFTDVIKAQGKKRKNRSADVALNYIKALYQHEKKAKTDGRSTREVYLMHAPGKNQTDPG